LYQQPRHALLSTAAEFHRLATRFKAAHWSPTDCAWATQRVFLSPLSGNGPVRRRRAVLAEVVGFLDADYARRQWPSLSVAWPSGALQFEASGGGGHYIPGYGDYQSPTLLVPAAFYTAQPGRPALRTMPTAWWRTYFMHAERAWLCVGPGRQALPRRSPVQRRRQERTRNFQAWP
jgi:hypothetical protein